MGREFIGVDLSQKYVEMAQRRIESVAPLFARAAV
jgi:DNA modification methylase